MNYDQPTPETDAFILHIDDSEIDLGMVESRMKDMEVQRDTYKDLLISAHAIAKRNGEGTAWEIFAARCQELGIGSITAKTFRKMPNR